MTEITKSKKVILITLLLLAYCIIPMIFLGILHPYFGYITCVVIVGIVLYTWHLLHKGDELKEERVSDR